MKRKSRVHQWVLINLLLAGSIICLTFLGLPRVWARQAAVDSVKGVVTWVEKGPLLRIRAQRLGVGGFIGDPYTLYELHAFPNSFVDIGPIHASADGRLLSFFTSEYSTLNITRDVRLVVITLDGEFDLTDVRRRKLSSSFVIQDYGEQIQVATVPLD